MYKRQQGISVVAVPAIKEVNESFDDRRSLSDLLEQQKKIDEKNNVDSSFLSSLLGGGSTETRLADRILKTSGIQGLRNSPLNKAAKNDALIRNGLNFDQAKGITDGNNEAFNSSFDESRINEINSRLGVLSSVQALQADRGVNVTQNVTTNIDQTVTQPSEAPSALARESADAVSRALIESDPVTP